jgi:pimeloyl-ACP methyl ester carboxylesterase
VRVWKLPPEEIGRLGSVSLFSFFWITPGANLRDLFFVLVFSSLADGTRSSSDMDATGVRKLFCWQRQGEECPVEFAAFYCTVRILAVSVLLASFQSLIQAQGNERPVERTTFYRTTQIDGLSIFYREAGPKGAPTLLLLHGLPSSSRMFEPLFARLSDRYHLVAPDYPGFGHSDWPDPKKFAYTFDHYAEIMNDFTEALGLARYTLYMQDYGGPVGFRMALAHPERIEALIVQDAVAHNEGLGANWKTRRAFWADRGANESALRTNLLSLATTRTRHVGDDPNVERYDPDLWTDEFYFLNQPGQAEIQSDLFYDYRTNVDAYPKWQAWMREKQPRLLVMWGRYELSFDASEPEAYRRDVSKAEVHIVDGGHFALDTAADQIAQLVRDFVNYRRGDATTNFVESSSD